MSTHAFHDLCAASTVYGHPIFFWREQEMWVSTTCCAEHGRNTVIPDIWPRWLVFLFLPELSHTGARLPLIYEWALHELKALKVNTDDLCKFYVRCSALAVLVTLSAPVTLPGKELTRLCVSWCTPVSSRSVSQPCCLLHCLLCFLLLHRLHLLSSFLMTFPH